MEDSIIVNSMGIGAGIFAGLVVFWFISVYLKKRIAADPSAHVAASAPAESYQEKRRHPRADVSWPAALKSPHDNIEHEAALKDISLGGAFVICKNPLPLNQQFQIVIKPQDRPALELKAEVVWSNANVPADKIVNRGMGIRFIDNSPQIRVDLNALIAAAFERSKIN